MLKKIIWPLTSFISISLSLVFISGFISSINISKAQEKEPIESPKDIPTPPAEVQKDQSDIVIMGDSIGFGIGDEENLGIGPRYINLINKDEKTEIDFTNISVPGYESKDLLELIRSSEDKSIISNANLIIISIGGNDLNRIESEDDLTLNIAFKETLQNYQENLTAIVEEIRTINPEAQLSFIGLYDPYGREEPEKTKLLLEWNYQTRLIVDSNLKLAYIPTYEEFEYHLDEYLSLDKFHPSGAGYQVIAKSLFRILN